MSRTAIVVLLAVSSIGLFPASAEAQRRGEAVEGLLRGYLESQLGKERERAVARQKLNDRQRYQQAPPVNNAPSPKLQQYRVQLGQFTNHSNVLAVNLQRSQVRGVRTLLPRALEMKTRATLMYRDAASANDLGLLREQYCDLDCQWRELSFQLQQLQGLDSATLGSVNQLNRQVTGICGLLELEPQFDRAVVGRLAIETSAHLDSLVDDIHGELYGVNGHMALVRDCRGLAQQCRRICDAVPTAAYDELQNRYSTFVTDWRRFAVKLHPFRNHHCDRMVRRIRGHNLQVFEQLWTPLAIDRAYLAYVSHGLAHDVHELFDNMTVKALIQLPAADQQAVLSAARGMYGQCDQYCQMVDGNRPLHDLVDSYVAIDRQWQTLDRYLRPVDSKQLHLARRRISAHDSELRQLLRVPAALDRQRAIALAAAMEEMATHLQYDTRRYGRYYQSAPFRNRAYQHSDAFLTQASNLHALLQRDADLGAIQKCCGDAVNAWNTFSGTISEMPRNGLSSSRFEHFNQSRQEVLPVAAELATILGG